MGGMRPTVGRIVHYVSYGTPGGEYGKECRAAVVTAVGEVFVPEGETPPEGTPVSLAVLNPEGMFFNGGVMQHEAPEGPGGETPAGLPQNHPGGTWHWPERA